MVLDAVLGNFEVIEEAAKRLDDVYRAAQPAIPWRALAGLRDVLIQQLPPLNQLERELAGEGETPEEG